MYANKIVLITGGSSGLGKNLALSYAREKAKIINLSRNSQKMAILNSVLNKLNSQKNKFYSVDVSDYDKILEVKDIILRENNIPDIIINNAAGNFLCPFENLSKNGW